MLQKIAEKFDNLTEVDKIAAVSKKVETVKLVMQENVDIALQNCVKLESIEKAAGMIRVPMNLFLWIGHLNCLIIFVAMRRRTGCHKHIIMYGTRTRLRSIEENIMCMT